MELQELPFCNLDWWEAPKMNKKGQFSIIAALLVSVLLVAAVISTYAAIRYSPLGDQPQVLSAIDETNLALKALLGFTVGYYGSVLQVTGNTSFATTLSSNYLHSGLENIGDIRPEWGLSFNVTNLDLSTNWFTPQSYSSGLLAVKYDLTLLGVFGMTYSTTCRLDVQTLTSPSSSQVSLSVLQDDHESLISLGKDNFNFYRYDYSDSTWKFVSPSNDLVAYANGTYVIDVPSGIDTSSYLVQIEDTRGILVSASSFSRYASTLVWNGTSVDTNLHYVDNNVSNVDSSVNKGTQSNFTAQKNTDNVFDSLTEAASGIAAQNYFPTYWNRLGSTGYVSGSTNDLQSNNGVYMRFRSYVSASSATSKTNAFVTYKTGSSSVPKEKTWTGDTATWSSEGSMPSAGNEVRSTRAAYSPLEQRSFEKIVVTMSLDDYIDAYVWDGTDWSATNNIGYVGPDANLYRSYDIAYEKASGRALLVYSRGTTSNEIGYRTWTFGTGWSSESTLNLPTSGIVYWVALATAPGTRSGTGDDNEIALIYMDENADVYGYVWTGSSWSNMGQGSVWDSSAAIAAEECVAVAYEQQSGRAMFVWGDSVSTDNYYRIWNGASLTSNTLLDISTQGGVTNWVTLKADPSSNALMYLTVDAASYLNTAYWSGSAWTATTQHDTGVDTNAQRCADFAWEPTGSKGLIVWGDIVGQISYRTFAAPNTWGSQQNPVMGSNMHYWVQLRTNPRSVSGDAKIIGAVLEYSDNDLGMVKWDGTTFTVVGDTTISSDTGTSTYECFELEFMNYGSPTEFTSWMEFTGSSNTASWDNLLWAIDGAATVSGVSATYQLYNYQTDAYPASGDGYMTDTMGTSDVTKSQTITTNPAYYRNSTGWWKLSFKAVKSTSTQFDINLDLTQYGPGGPNYALDLEEQWTNVTDSKQDLCIKAGAPGSENLMVDVWHSGSWTNVLASLATGWNNVSIADYIDSNTVTMRFRGASDIADSVQNTWTIDAALIKPQPGVGLILSMQDSQVAVEFLQNGTLRWFGQNLQLNTPSKPIPPIPVKAIHVNQTVGGVEREVPFQVEDWASEYRIAQGLAANTTIFSNKQMVVFLLNTSVSKFTVWWDGSDDAVQTPLAYTNRYFTGDDPSSGIMTNGLLTLQFGGGFVVTSTVGSASSTATFMRINSEASVYGASPAYVIHHGIVRDIIQQEAEWSGGAVNSPNVHANIILTLPAGVTYFNYHLRFMFLTSQQSRTITDLSPIKLSTSISQLQTENGTSLGFPIVKNGTGTFSNYNVSGVWTAHHWSQFISGTAGAGIMFTDSNNQQLYHFDSMAGGATGAIKTDSTARTIELLPVTIRQVQFTSALDIAWNGAVATFDGTSPIYKIVGGNPTGLWILAEYPPSITVIAES
jgi:hypothetical protein